MYQSSTFGYRNEWLSSNERTADEPYSQAILVPKLYLRVLNLNVQAGRQRNSEPDYSGIPLCLGVLDLNVQAD